MATLAAMQRCADRTAAKLGIATPVTVRFSGGDCKLRRRWHLAHAHCHPSDPMFGAVCVRRGLGKGWENTIRHEVAHFAAPKGAHHRQLAFVQACATLGDNGAKSILRHEGRMRCPRHEWRSIEQLSSHATSKGLVCTYRAKCRNCGRVIG